ncbi:MAG: PEP-CTERM sorting domain-containing protein, partial [archaeon]
ASNTFSFEPANFSVSSTGKTAYISDSFQFDIELLAGEQIDKIAFAEAGRYSIAGTGSVKTTCSITIQNLDVYQQDPLIKTFNVFEETSDSAGGIVEWSGSFEFGDIDISWSHIRITVSNRLIARNSSGDGSESWIQKDMLGVNGGDGAGIEIIMVPEPATVGILTIGSLAISAFGRKRRMLRYAKSFLICAAVLFFLVAVQSADAGFIPWDNQTGGNSNFSWTSGGSELDLFDSPDLDSGNTLIFSPLSFEAVSFDGEVESEDTVSDRLEFVLQDLSGYGFQTILITENGNYEIDGTGAVTVSGQLSVANLDSAEVLENSFSFTLNSSTWQGSAQLSIPAGWTNMKITFQNTISATTAGYGSFALIANTDTGINIQIPEPATVCILSLGVLSLIRRKK